MVEQNTVVKFNLHKVRIFPSRFLCRRQKRVKPEPKSLVAPAKQIT